MIRRILAPRQDLSAPTYDPAVTSPTSTATSPALTSLAVTISQSPTSTATSLDIDPDPSHTGLISGISLPTLTVTETSSISATPSSTSRPATTHSAITTPVIIGIAVGAFALLAVSLVIFMVVRNKRSQRSRRRSQTHTDDSEKQRQRYQKSTPVKEAEADMSFLSLGAARGMVRQNAPPTLPRPDVNGSLSIPSRFRFTSPTPTHSSVPSSSNSHRHANDTYGLLAPHHSSRQYTHVSSPSVAASSLSDYSEAFGLGEYQSPSTDGGERETSSMTNIVTRASSMVDYRENITDYPSILPAAGSIVPKLDPAAPARMETGSRRSVPSKSGTGSTTSSARDREFKAMKDLIAALDASRSDVSPFSSSDLRIETTQATGMSRLSLGEGMVTPGGLK